MHIKTLRLRNFRGFEDAALDLDRPLTVLFGINGSGKSSVLAALAAAFRGMLSNFFENVPPEIASVIHRDDVRLGTEETTIVIDVRREGLRDIEHCTFSYQLVAKDAQGIPQGWAFENRTFEPSSRKKGFLPIYYDANRSVPSTNIAFSPASSQGEPSHGQLPGLVDTLSDNHIDFLSFFIWFKEREDAENRLKVHSKNLNAADPQLSAVRRAIQNLLPGFSDLRIQHDPLRLEVRKGEQTLSINQLSDGEKMVLAMTADIARRLAMAYPDASDPLEQEAIVLVDEIELHLHPAWQRRVLPAWTKTFTNTQFIVTTHSPQVISEVPSDAVFCIENFLFVHPGAPTAGRDSNSILEEAMGTIERPESIKYKLAHIGQLIDGEQYPAAGEELNALAQEISENDHEIVRLRTLLHFMGGGDAPDSKKP